MKYVRSSSSQAFYYYYYYAVADTSNRQGVSLVRKSLRRSGWEGTYDLSGIRGT